MVDTIAMAYLAWLAHRAPHSDEPDEADPWWVWLEHDIRHLPEVEEDP